jgi:IS4 transposase
VRDDLIRLTGPARKHYPVELRRVVARVEVDGEAREMIFLTNQLTWSAQTIADLYRCRWQIEVFFKQLKQTLQLTDFLGNSAHAVRWQVWTALLTYVLLRFAAWLSQWGHSFTRLFALLRSALWQKLELRSLLEAYGTAGGGGRFLGTPQQAYLAGFG